MSLKKFHYSYIFVNVIEFANIFLTFSLNSTWLLYLITTFYELESFTLWIHLTFIVQFLLHFFYITNKKMVFVGLGYWKNNKTIEIGLLEKCIPVIYWRIHFVVGISITKKIFVFNVLVSFLQMLVKIVKILLLLQKSYTVGNVCATVLSAVILKYRISVMILLAYVWSN